MTYEFFMEWLMLSRRYFDMTMPPTSATAISQPDDDETDGVCTYFDLTWNEERAGVWAGTTETNVIVLCDGCADCGLNMAELAFLDIEPHATTCAWCD